MADATATFRAARDFLLEHATDYEGAVAGFSWPELPEFNWAQDWFDVIAAEHPDRAALRIVEDDGSDAAYSYGELARALAAAGGVVAGTRRTTR